MTLYEIDADTKVAPGEYILYVPDDRIVVCGEFNPSHGMIRAWGAGKYIEDKMDTFRKISLTTEENYGLRKKRSRCKACGG